MAKKQQAKKKNSIRSEALSDLREIRKMVKDAIADGAKNVEQVRQAIAKLPFKYLEKIELVEDTARDVKNAQEKTIGQVYSMLRTINDKVDDLAEDLLNKVEGKSA